jgi:hypothetical protein
MNVARKVSSKLSGTANQRIAGGKTLIFQVTTHISTKPKNHPIIVVCNRLNFLESMKMAIAKSSDHKP